MKKRSNWLNHLFNFLSVILGVYLAFYVNDAANSAKESKESVLLMNSMINDISADIETYEEYTIPVNEKYQAAIDSMLTLLSTNDMTAINNQLAVIFQVENYTPSTSTYNSMKSSGKIRLIEDLTLQKKLSDYYDGLVQECVKKNEIQAEYFINEVVSWLTIHADLMEMKLLEEDDALIVLRNKLLIYGSLLDQKIDNYKMIVEESKELKAQLDSLIKIQ